ncbi:hypothetical protein AAMO2058_000144200 [Amorphochlora amoebiformis]
MPSIRREFARALRRTVTPRANLALASPTIETLSQLEGKRDLETSIKPSSVLFKCQLRPHVRGWGGERVRITRKSILNLFGSEEIRRKAASSRTWDRWAGLARVLLRSGGASTGNKVTILNCGDKAFSTMWDAIDNARESIHMETYILRMDNVGQKTLKRLLKARSRGVQISLMYDSVGSTSLPMFLSQTLSALRKGGARVVEFNPLISGPHRFFRRNHRKILLVDGTVAFCGGMNIADEYCGIRMGGTGRFHDTHVRIEGPAALDFAKVVRDSIREAFWSKDCENSGIYTPPSPFHTSKLRNLDPGLFGSQDPKFIGSQQKSDEFPLISPYFGHAEAGVQKEGVCVQVLAANSWRNQRQLQRSVRMTIQYATTRCFITSPYFLPPPSLLRAMIQASKRGVDVRVLTCGENCDVPGVQAASRYIYSKLLHYGVRIFEYQPATLHSKAVCVDSIYSFVGSFNFDRWSYHRNLEVGMGMLDAKVTHELEAEFLKNVAMSREITLADIQRASIIERAKRFLCYIVASV